MLCSAKNPCLSLDINPQEERLLYAHVSSFPLTLSLDLVTRTLSYLNALHPVLVKFLASLRHPPGTTRPHVALINKLAFDFHCVDALAWYQCLSLWAALL